MSLVVAKLKRLIQQNFLSFSLLSTFLVLVVIATSVLFFEHQDPHSNIKTIGDAIWWGFVSISTVGYGDRYPVTTEGRILAVALFSAGLIMISIITAKVSSEFFRRVLAEGRGIMDAHHLKNHLLICGWKDNMENLLEHVLEFNPDLKPENLLVMANLDAEHIREITEFPKLKHVQFIVGEYFNEVNLRKAAPERARKILILSDQTPHSNGQRPTIMEADARTIMTAMTLAKISPATPVAAEIVDPKMAPYLKLAHVHEIIFPREYSRLLLSNASSSAGIANIIFDLLDPHTPTVIRTVEIISSLQGLAYKDFKEKFIELHPRCMLIGLLQNTGNSHKIKDAALKAAQKTPNTDVLVKNLQKVKNLKFNHPIFNPDGDFLVEEHCSAIVLEERLV